MGLEDGSWEETATPIFSAETKAPATVLGGRDPGSKVSLPGPEPLGKSLILNQHLSKGGL